MRKLDLEMRRVRSDRDRKLSRCDDILGNKASATAHTVGPGTWKAWCRFPLQNKCRDSC